MESIWSQEAEQIEREGWEAAAHELATGEVLPNPYDGLTAEYWTCGWIAAMVEL